MKRASETPWAGSTRVANRRRRTRAHAPRMCRAEEPETTDAGQEDAEDENPTNAPRLPPNRRTVRIGRHLSPAHESKSCMANHYNPPRAIRQLTGLSAGLLFNPPRANCQPTGLSACLLINAPRAVCQPTGPSVVLVRTDCRLQFFREPCRGGGPQGR